MLLDGRYTKGKVAKRVHLNQKHIPNSKRIEVLGEILKTEWFADLKLIFYLQ